MKNKTYLIRTILLGLSVLSLSSEESLTSPLESKSEDYLTRPEHDMAIVAQKDFFDKHNPGDYIKKNRTPAREVRMNSHLDLSQFSDEVVQSSGIPVIESPARYNQIKPRWDNSRMLPSLLGPTGLLDSISARGLPHGKTAASYHYGQTKVTRTNLFKNVQSHEATDSNLILNHGIHDNFEVSLRVLKSTRYTDTTIGTRFDSAQDGFPESSYGLKAHQKVGKSEIALGFMSTNVDQKSRNLILDQEFERFRTAYFTLTSPFTYRTESHFTVKHNDTDNKFVNNNTWFSWIAGMDTKLNKDTHLLGEIKYEDFDAQTSDIVFNGGIRHRVSDFFVDAYMMRGNQKGYSEAGFKISGAF
ncbi:MAG: hypothetical protein H3C47_07815 [Candidatus Cloacimonetes bacterium]|nr:hypothetical protein [Candidatus Cloacimonadota bacterium]